MSLIPVKSVFVFILNCAEAGGDGALQRIFSKQKHSTATIK